MTSSTTTLPPDQARPPGLIGQAMLKLLSEVATVQSVSALSARLRLVTLRADAFRKSAAVPGDKLQVRVAGLQFRTYTPLRLTGGADALDFVAFLHGGATPSAGWLAALRGGQACHVRGPRPSLDLAGMTGSTVFFGDETSLGLAASLCTLPLGGLDTHFVLEVDDVEDTRRAVAGLARFGLERLPRVQLVRRRADRSHLAEVEDALARHAGADAFRQFVLSGDAGSIQPLVRSLRAAGVKPSRMLVKAYWAAGKVGMD